MHATSAINSTITQASSSPRSRLKLGHQCEPDGAGDGWETTAATSLPSQELLAPPPPDVPPPNPEKPPPGPLPPEPPPKLRDPPEPPLPPRSRLASWKAAAVRTETYQIHTRISPRNTR